MNFLSIEPPAPFLLKEKVFVTLGILELDAILEQKGHNIKHLDLLGSANCEADISRALNQYDLDYILITSTTPQFPNANNILDFIKTETDVPVIIGGAHATLTGLYRQYKLDELNYNNDKTSIYCVDPNFAPLEKFDKIFVGEAETGFLNCLNSKEKWFSSELTADLDAVPFPARHLINMKDYKWHLKTDAGNLLGTNVMTQRGCPFRCYFCSGRTTYLQLGNYKKTYKTPYNTVRNRSSANILSELDHLHEHYGLDAFMFFDDEFNLNVARVKQVCKDLENREYKWRAFVKSELFVKNPETAEIMSRAGCVEVGIGVESGSKRILEEIVCKNTTPEINGAAVALAHKYGIRCKAFTIVGHASETYDDIMATKNWLLQYRPDDFDVTILQPYPGSLAYNFLEEYQKRGLIYDRQDFSKDMAFYKSVPGEYRCAVSTPTLSSKRLVELRDEIDKDVRQEFGLAKISKN